VSRPPQLRLGIWPLGGQRLSPRCWAPRRRQYDMAHEGSRGGSSFVSTITRSARRECEQSCLPAAPTLRIPVFRRRRVMSTSSPISSATHRWGASSTAWKPQPSIPSPSPPSRWRAS
jgi:hypothetical protein